MLSKKVCRHCCDEGFKDALYGWNEVHEDLWLNGYVICPLPKSPKSKGLSLCGGGFGGGGFKGFAAVADVAPEWCPYTTEHVVSQDAE